ncbi:MAG: ACT domain-containing protein [Verrucomicrobia bacterium]|nr:MAG: ACT domain-containing protein [Verrucomicrobiota bacterium]
MTYSVKRQLTVALENRPGRLAEISEAVTEAGCDIEALCVVDNVEQGVVRLLVDDADRARERLIEEGFYVVEAEVLAINLTDSRGRLAQLTRALANARINIDYAYSTVDHQGGHTLLVMKVSNVRLAEQVLRELSGREA